MAEVTQETAEQIAERRYQERREGHVPRLPVWEALSETQRAGAIAAVEAETGLDENGVNEHGVLMCECGNKRAHAWEPGEWCSPDRVIPGTSKDKGEKR